MSSPPTLPDDARVYSDGGLCLASPSKVGGSWAWVAVCPKSGLALREASGHIRPGDLGVARLSSNAVELLAAVRALESLPDSWRGTLFTDSHTTLVRLCSREPGRVRAPGLLRCRFLAARGRFPGVRVTLVGGHPTRDDLRAGKNGRGRPVSPWNARCDLLCQEAARQLLQEERLI